MRQMCLELFASSRWILTHWCCAPLTRTFPRHTLHSFLDVQVAVAKPSVDLSRRSVDVRPVRVRFSQLVGKLSDFLRADFPDPLINVYPDSPVQDELHR